jgi:DNA mismatch repair protein MutS2
MDELLASLVMEREKFKRLNDGLEEEKQELHSARTRLESEMQKMVEDERMLLRNTKEDLLEDAATLQKMIHEVETELRKTRKKEAVERGKAALHTMNESLSGEKWQTRGGRAADDAAELLRQPVQGDTVRFIDRNLEGIVVSSEDGGKQLDIQIGNTRVTVNASEVEKTDTIEAGAVPAGPVISKTLDSLPASREIDLRGKRAHEVSNQLDRFLNDAFLAHFKEVRIVHGYATGTVRKIVREILSGHPLVKSFRPGGKDEGGDGVTVVQL